MRVAVVLLLFSTPALAQSNPYIDRAVYGHYALGVYRAGLGDWPGAARDFERAYRLRQSSPEILLKLAESNFKIGRMAEARKYAQRALDHDTSSTDPRVILAAVALEEGDLTAAERHLTRRIQDRPLDLEARLRLGLIRENQGDMEGVVAVFSGYPPRHPGAAVAHFHRGIALIRLERLPEARTAFADALREESEYIDAARNIAIISEELGDDTRAIDDWARVIEIDPMNQEATRRKVALLLEHDRTGEAQSEIVRLLEMDPDKSGVIKKLLAGVALRNKDYGLAARTLLKIAKDVGTETGYLEVAFIAAQAGTETSVISAAIEEAYKISPNPNIGLMLVRMRLALGDESAIDLSRTLAARATETTTIWNLGLLHHGSDDVDGAVELLLMLLEREPDHAPALNFVGYTWAEKGINLERAERMILRALEIEPGNGQYLDSLGWVYFKMGQIEKARIELERALENVPDEPTVLEHLGDVALASGRTDRALDFYRRSLETGKSENEALLRTKISDLE